MSYHASVYMKDKNGEYTIPILNEYKTTKLLRVGFVAKLLRGITVEQPVIEQGIELNQYYGKEPDRFAKHLLTMSLNGTVSVCIKNTTISSTAVPKYWIILKDALGAEEKYNIPKDITTMSSVLFGNWINQVDDNGPEIDQALKICGFYQFEHDDVAVKGSFK